MSARLPVVLVKGSDDVLRGEALTKAIAEAVGDADRTLVLDEFELDFDEVPVGAAVDAAQTPPFLTDFRVVVVRHMAQSGKIADFAELMTYLEDPLPSTTLILVWEKSPKPNTKQSPLPPKLTKAVTGAGGEVVTADGGGRNVAGWVAEQFDAAGLKVDRAARDRIVETIGEDSGAVVGIIERLKGAFTPGTSLRLADVEPFIGPAGGVPPWDLTDAIDKGDVALAIGLTQRMMSAGGRHALAVMSTLQTHYLRMLKLDGANVRGEKEAAAHLGMKGSTFPAKKALAQGKKLGPGGLRRSVALIAEADVDLRGARAWPDELVMELLVARLARLAR